MQAYLKSEIDDLDLQIIKILLNDAKIPYLEVARQCDVSGATVHLRIKKLEDIGIIKGSRLIIDTHRLGYGVCCFAGLHLNSSSALSSVIKRLNDIPAITELHYTTGAFPLFIKINSKDSTTLRKVLSEDIASIADIQSIDSFLSLETLVDRNVAIT